MTPFIYQYGEDVLEQFMSGVIAYGNELHDLDGEIILRRNRDGRIETFGDHWIEDIRNEGGQP